MAKQEKSDENVGHELNTDSVSAGKGRPTPTRKEREAANMRPLVSNDRQAASREARAKRAQYREKARVGMAAGDDKFLPARDKGEQRRWVRDYVDARFSVGEILLPVMFIVIILMFVQDPMVQFVGIVGLWLFFIVAILDGIFLGSLVTKKLAAKYGAEHVRAGTRWYSAMRAMQLRVIRLPKPQVKRGQFPS